MILDGKRSVDPRDNLDRYRRRELVEIAHARGLTHITEQWPADLIRDEFRSKGISRLPPAPRPALGSRFPTRTFPLGKAPPPPTVPDIDAPAVEVNVNADLRRQFMLEQQRAAAAVPADKPIDKMGINELRKECQRLNIAMGRRDKTEDLRAKVKAAINDRQDAA